MRDRLLNVRPSLGTVLGLLALLVATGGVAVAAVPGADRTVTACISSGGNLKVIDAESGDQCQPNAASVTLAATGPGGKVSDSDLLDGRDSTDFLGAGGKAADADRLDGRDSTDFLGAGAKAADADRLDGRDITYFLGVQAKAADADLLDGRDAVYFLRDEGVVVHTADTTLGNGSVGSGTASCGSGERAVGGGVQLVGATGPTFDAGSPVLFSRPHVAPSNTGVASPLGWQAAMLNGTGSSVTMRVWVICVS